MRDRLTWTRAAGGRALTPKNVFGCPSIRTKAVSRHKTPLQCFSHRVTVRVVEYRSSETLTVNQLSANRSANHRYGLNSDHDSSIRIPVLTGTRAPNPPNGLACAGHGHPPKIRPIMDTIRKLDKIKQIGQMGRYAFTGWNCKEGWLIASPQFERYADKAIWVKTRVDFYLVPRVLVGQELIRVASEHAELSDDEKRAILRMTWHWEFWVQTEIEGKCVISSLAKMLDLSEDALKEMFIAEYCNPAVKEDVIYTLRANGYEVNAAGPNGFGYGEERRLVFMRRIARDGSGHVVLIYEDDKSVFDTNNKFRKPADFLMARGMGYEIDDVLLIEKI
jgi:hypothetical protein